MQQPDAARGDRPRGPRATRDDEAYNETPSPTRNFESDVESDGGNVSIKLLAYQGGQRPARFCAGTGRQQPYPTGAEQRARERDAARAG